MSQRGALAILILVELLAFSFMSQTVVFPTLIGLATIFGWQRPRRIRVSPDRQVIIALLVGVLFVAGWRINPHQLPEDAMPYLSPFLHSLGQYLLLLQTAALYLWHERDILPIMLPWPGVFIMVSAGDINASHNQRATFQVVAILFIALTALYFSTTAQATAGYRSTRYGLGKRSAMALMLIAMASGAWVGSTALHRYEQELNRIVSEMIAPTAGSSGAGFPSRSELGSISDRKSAQADDIALRIKSPHRPGYWRGKVYHWLEGTLDRHTARITRWEDLPPVELTSAGEALQDQILQPRGRVGELFRYVLAETRRPPSTPRSEVWLEPPQRGIYFLPPSAVEIFSNEDSILSDYRQTISTRDRAVMHYFVSVGTEKRAGDALVQPREGTGPFSIAALTSVPKHTGVAGSDPGVQALAEEIFTDCESFDEHLLAVENYFHSNYQYHIGINVPSGVDPIAWFLNEKPSAHCEYFAQGAALLLRMRGIPTRYVTGFVVSERNTYGDHWIARNEDAHAWCEAWDANRGWVLVEATPAAGIPAADETARHRQVWEYFRGALERFRYRFARGGWPWLATQVGRFLATPAGWLVLLLILGYLGLRARMLIAARQGRLPRLVMKLHRLLRRMDRRMERGGLTRAPGETLTRFAERVATETGDFEAADWYASYAAARYGGNLNESRVTALRERLDRKGAGVGR